MINPARLHSDLSRLGRETDMFLATVSSLSDEELVAPSLCEGWTRAQVIAHVASSGRALVGLIDWATSGEERQLYASPEARSQAIAALAALPREELLAEVRDSAAAFAGEAQRLTGELVAPEVKVGGRERAAPATVARRVAGMVLRHTALETRRATMEVDPDSLLN